MKKTAKHLEHFLEGAIFFGRWVQLPVYLGLVIASGMYAYKFIIQLIEMFVHFHEFTETSFMLAILGLIDISMVINLLVVVCIGGYITFVSKMHFSDSEDVPAWLQHINANSLKIKLIVSLVSISGIHLLKTFVSIDQVGLPHAFTQIAMHLVFIISALLLAKADRIMHDRYEVNRNED
jgi:uncharacterized protein (TIGR00645 family)